LEAIELGVVLDFQTCEVLLGRPGQAVTAPGGEVLMRPADSPLVRVPARALAHRRAVRGLRLGRQGQAVFGGRIFRWSVEASKAGGRPPCVLHGETFDAGRVGDRIVLRHWRAGDRFRPIGMSSSVKLQDLFTNQKVPAEERRARVVAESGSGEVFWVEGLRIGERFKVGPDTRKQLVWRWSC
jgi:tRNA(Ile)-lysidine synthase